MWHKWLVHPSHEILLLLPSSLAVIFDKNKEEVCETCYRAKQTHNRFLIRCNKAKCVFKLIHYEMEAIWGIIIL